MSKLLGYSAAAGYIGSVLVANYLSTKYGLVAIGFGLTASAGTYAAGAALGLRDYLQSIFGRYSTLPLIAVAAVLSYAVSSPAIATASAVAFLCSELTDFAVYTPLRKRGWVRAVVASVFFGALVDSVVFLHISGFGVTLSSVEGQMVGKFLWAVMVPVAIIQVAKRAFQWARS